MREGGHEGSHEGGRSRGRDLHTVWHGIGRASFCVVLSFSERWSSSQDTLRENIIFGQPFEEARYWRVVKACQLEHDLALLDEGDLTSIGERGINLSGGAYPCLTRVCPAHATSPC